MKDRTFERNPFWTLVLFITVTCGLILCVVEVVLRLMGEAPCIYAKYTRGTPKVEKLIVSREMITDGEGIFKINRNPPNGQVDPDVNQAGFRSREFIPQPNLPTILMLGDSFAWGASAETGKSFAALLEKAGFAVYNTGIPGVFPAQYARLAEKYVPLLKPKVTAVMFFMGNDLRRDPQMMIPHRDLWHITNAGWLPGFDGNGRPITAQESFEQIYPKQFLDLCETKDGSAKGLIRRAVSSTALGKMLWVSAGILKQRCGPTAQQSADHNAMLLLRERQDRETLLRIKQVAEHHGSHFLLFLIPEHPDSRTPENRISDNLYVFSELNPLFPDESLLSTSDYTSAKTDGHFNNEGHRKYAEFMLPILRARMAIAGH